MKQGSTLLKVISIIMIIFAILAMIGGVLFLVGGGMIAGSGAIEGATGNTLSISNTGEVSGSDADMAVLGMSGAFVVGIAFIIAGIIDLIIGIVGVKASKTNGKHTGAFLLGIIGVVFAGLTLIGTLASSSGDIGSSLAGGVVGLVLPVLYLVGVIQTRKPPVMTGGQQPPMMGQPPMA